MMVEDHTAIRQMLSTFVAALPGFVVVAEADNVESALAMAAEHRPDVVVLDWMLRGRSGLDFLRDVRIDPPPRVLVFSALTTELAVREALAAGALGYIEKAASFVEFTSALRAVAEGKTCLGPAASEALRRAGVHTVSCGCAGELTTRERDVLRLLAEGLSSKEIAERLNLATRTVENHRARIMQRTGLRSVAQLALHAVRLGLVDALLPEVSDEAACA